MFFENFSNPGLAFYGFIAIVAALWSGVGLFIREVLGDSKNHSLSLAYVAAYLTFWLTFAGMLSLMAGPLNGSRLASFGEVAMVLQVVMALGGAAVGCLMVTAMALVNVMRVMNEQFARGQ